jgi:hypothetical protein
MWQSHCKSGFERALSAVFADADRIHIAYPSGGNDLTTTVVPYETAPDWPLVCPRCKAGNLEYEMAGTWDGAQLPDRPSNGECAAIDF